MRSFDCQSLTRTVYTVRALKTAFAAFTLLFSFALLSGCGDREQIAPGPETTLQSE